MRCWRPITTHQLEPPWALDPQTDQDLGAAVWVGVGDLINRALLTASMSQWEDEDARQAHASLASFTTGQPCRQLSR